MDGKAKALPPFLSKTYDIVDDPSTDSIISWGTNNNSLIVWDPTQFERLLPKNFKHGRLSSFIRQLHTYGFRKVDPDPDRWEYANEGFVRGQKHLLKTISRQKPAQGKGHQQYPCVEVGKFGLEEEVERLKRDKDVLKQELVTLRQQQKSTDKQLQTMVQHIRRMENRQQEFMSFLAKAVQSPHFLSQFLQQQQQKDTNKKRKFISNADESASRDGQIVKYQQPPMPEQANAMFEQLMKTGDDGFLLGNGTCTTEGTEMEALSNHTSGIINLQEIPTSSPTLENVSAAPEATENCTDDFLTLPEFNHMLQENNADANFMEPNIGGSSSFLDPDLLINDSLPFDIDDLRMDPHVDSFDYNILEDFLMSSSIPDDMDLTAGDNETAAETPGNHLGS